MDLGLGSQGIWSAQRDRAAAGLDTALGNPYEVLKYMVQTGAARDQLQNFVLTAKQLELSLLPIRQGDGRLAADRIQLFEPPHSLTAGHQ